MRHSSIAAVIYRRAVVRAGKRSLPSLKGLLLRRGVLLMKAVAAVGHGKAAVGHRADLDVVGSTFIRHTGENGAAGTRVGDQLLRRIEVGCVHAVMQLPDV